MVPGGPGWSGARLPGTTSARKHANKEIWGAAIGCRRHSSQDPCVNARKSARDEPAHFCVGGDAGRLNTAVPRVPMEFYDKRRERTVYGAV